MKQSILGALALCLTTTFLAGFCQAQDDKDQNRSQTQPDKNRSTIGAPGTSSTSAYGTSSSTQSKSTRLSKLMNTTIKDQQGEALGQVQDLVVDAESGQIQFVVLSLSGTSGKSDNTGFGKITSLLGSRLTAVPWRLVTPSGADQFTLNVDRDKLQSAPTFSHANWPSMDPSWSQRIYSHFGVEQPTSTGAPGSGTGTGTGTGTPGVPQTPGTPDINAPKPDTGNGTQPGTVPGLRIDK